MKIVNTAFHIIVQEMLEGTHTVNGKKVLPRANLRGTSAPLLNNILMHFGALLHDFEETTPLAHAARTDFVNKVLWHCLFRRIGHPRQNRCIAHDAASLGMVLSVHPELIHSGRSIEEMLDIHYSIVEMLPDEPETPRPRVATFKDGYYLDELTTRRHFIDEGIDLNHCAGDMIKIWDVPRSLRPGLRYAELQFFHEVLTGEWRHLSFGREGEGPLTTIQFNQEYDYISMVGPKFAARHTGMETYFPAFINALVHFAETQDGITVYICDTCAPVVMQGIQEHRTAARHIHCASAFIRYPDPLLDRTRPQRKTRR